jgi:hypothetical protein
MKTIHANVQTQIDTAIGTSPYTTIEIGWIGGTVTYTDNDKILDASTVQTEVRLGMIGEMQNVSVVLDDIDGSLKVKYNTDQIEGLPCTIYQSFGGISEKVPIITGRIIGDIVWSEGSRQLSFNVESIYESANIGYAPEEGDVENLHPDAVGVPWPICFGNVLHSRAVQIRKSYKATLSKPYRSVQNIIHYASDDSRRPPEGINTNVRIGGIRFNGTFYGEQFTIAAKNLPYYTNVTIADREEFATVDGQDASILWISDPTIRLVGLYCLVQFTGIPGSGYMVNQCVYQMGNKCYFLKTWRKKGETLEHRIDPQDYTLLEAAPLPRSSWPETYHADTVVRRSGNRTWFIPNVDVVVASAAMPPDRFSIKEGAEILAENTFSDLYVANLVQSLEIRGVYAYRSIEGKRTFVPVPMSYYTKYLSMSLAGHTITALEVDDPLEFRLGENWESGIYVTLRSSIGNNIIQGLSWMINNYTSLTPDSASFTDTFQRSSAYPVAYTVYDQPSAIQLAQRVAFLGRCAMVIRDGKVFIKYLSRDWDADITVDETNTEYKSLELTSTLTEDIKTRLLAKWTPDDSDRNAFTETYERNIDKYGLMEEELDVFIYIVRKLVRQTVAYWGYMYSNAWREIILSNFLETLPIDPYDVASVDVDVLSTNAIKGFVRALSHNTEQHSIQMKVRLASLMGVSTGGQPIEDEDAWTGDPDVWNGDGVVDDSDTPPEDPTDGVEETDDEVLSDPSDDDPSTDPVDQDTDTYSYQILTNQSFVRGVSQALTVEVRDDSGYIAWDGSGTPRIRLTDRTDTDDILYDSTTALARLDVRNGVWSSTDVNIDDGAGDQLATIEVSGGLSIGGQYKSVRTARLAVTITGTDTGITWVTYPLSVTRGTGFSISLTDGPAETSRPIRLNSTDPMDKIVDTDGNAVTSILFDSEGDHASTLVIVGGTQEAVGNLDVLSVGNIPVSSPDFPITGIGDQAIQQTIETDDAYHLSELEIDIQEDGDFDGESFDLTLTMTKGGSTDTSFNGWVFVLLVPKTIGYKSFGDQMPAHPAGTHASTYAEILSVSTDELDHVSGWTATSFSAYLVEGEWTGTLVMNIKIFGEYCLVAAYQDGGSLIKSQTCQTSGTIPDNLFVTFTGRLGVDSTSFPGLWTYWGNDTVECIWDEGLSAWRYRLVEAGLNTVTKQILITDEGGGIFQVEVYLKRNGTSYVVTSRWTNSSPFGSFSFSDRTAPAGTVDELTGVSVSE